jgi:hypothetical protein
MEPKKKKRKLTSKEKIERVKWKAKIRERQAAVEEKQRREAHAARLAKPSKAFQLKQERIAKAQSAYEDAKLRRELKAGTSGDREKEILERFRAKHGFSKDVKLRLDRKTGNILATTASVVKDGKAESKLFKEEGNEQKAVGDGGLSGLPGGDGVDVRGPGESGVGGDTEESKGAGEAAAVVGGACAEPAPAVEGGGK